MSSRALRIAAILCLFLITTLSRLPLIRDSIDVKPDGCEYLGIARHLARGEGWLSSIKWHFFTDDPPRHPALADRPPLFPLLAAGVWKLTEPNGDPVFAVRAANVLLTGIDSVLAYLLLEALFGAWTAGAAALLFALYPAWMRDSAQPLTEPLFIALWLTAFLIYHRAPDGRLSWRRGAALGIVSGLAYLTRPTGLLLPIYFVLLELWNVRNGKRPPGGAPWSHALLALCAGFALAWIPYGIAVAREYGSPFTSILSYNFSIRHIYEGTLYGFERTYPRPAQFIASRPGEITGLIAGQCWVLASALGRSLRFLLPLLFLVRRDRLRVRAHLLLFAALNFCFYAVSWTVWGAGRYLLPTYLLLAALLLEGAALQLDRARVCRSVRERSLAAFGLACFLSAIIAALAADLRLHREKARPDAGIPLGWAFRAVADELRREASREPVTVAANQPWILNLLSEQPARMAARFRDEAQARRYLDRYPVSHLAYFADEPKDARVLEMLAPRRDGRRTVAPALADRLELIRFDDRRATPPGRATQLVLFRTRG